MSKFVYPIAPGSCYFFTVRLADASSDLLVHEIDLLRDTIRLTRQCHPFVIEAAAILPNRIHMIWTMPPGDDDYGLRWQMIKTTFARHAIDRYGRKMSGIWQRRYWEQPVRTVDEMQAYTDAVGDAAVEDGLVRDPRHWPYSSLWVGRTKPQLHANRDALMTA